MQSNQANSREDSAKGEESGKREEGEKEKEGSDHHLLQICTVLYDLHHLVYRDAMCTCFIHILLASELGGVFYVHLLSLQAS